MDLCFFSQPFFRGFSMDLLASARPLPGPPSPGTTLLDLAEGNSTRQKHAKVRLDGVWAPHCCLCSSLPNTSRCVLTVDIFMQRQLSEWRPGRKQADPDSFLLNPASSGRLWLFYYSSQTLHNLQGWFNIMHRLHFTLFKLQSCERTFNSFQLEPQSSVWGRRAMFLIMHIRTELYRDPYVQWGESLLRQTSQLEIW